TDSQIHDALGAERRHGLARLRVHLLEQAVHGEDQTLLTAVGALPVVQATARHSVPVFANPQLLAGFRVHGDERTVASAAVDHTADDDGAATGISERIRPRDPELAAVLRVDLSGA